MTAQARAAVVCARDLDRMQLWAGQGAPIAKAAPVSIVLQGMWTTAQGLPP
jgi:hypothetical protein